MTLEEFYQTIVGDYAFMHASMLRDSSILKYLHKFAQEVYFDKLQSALAAKDYQMAFEHAHSLKGETAMLCLGILNKDVCALTEALNPKHDAERTEAKINLLNTKVIEARAKVLEAIAQLD